MAGIRLPAHLCRCEERRSGLGDLSSFYLPIICFTLVLDSSSVSSLSISSSILLSRASLHCKSGAHKTKKPSTFRSRAFGPSGESRTHGLLNPIQARYQTALHPDVTLGDINNYSTFCFKVKCFLKKFQELFLSQHRCLYAALPPVQRAVAFPARSLKPNK